MGISLKRLHRLSLVCVPTRNQDSAVAFYENIGFEKKVDVPMGDGQRWVEVYLPGNDTGIALAPPPGDEEIVPILTGITLTTDDINATHTEMKALGVDVDEAVLNMGGPVPPIFWFRDPTGHTLMIVEQPKDRA